MLEEIRLRNIQNHKKRTIKLDPQVTTFVGATDAGKTAIIRGLGLLCLNDWDACYLSHDKTTCSVGLVIDGHRLVRTKGKRVNLYSLDGKKFRAFGNTVPPEIAGLLNVGEENFQNQCDPHFWFNETPGQVSKKLNAIVNLGLIDSTLGNIAADLRKVKIEVDLVQERLIEARKTRNGLAWIVDYSSELAFLEQLENERDLIAQNRAKLALLIAQTGIFVANRDNALKRVLDASKLIAQLSEWQMFRSRSEQLERLLQEARKLRRLVETPLPDFQPVIEARVDGDEAAERRRNLEHLLGEALIERKNVCRLSKEVRLLLKQLSRQRGRCPQCGQLLSRKGK